MGNAATVGGNMGGGAIIRVFGPPIPIALQNRSAAIRTIVPTNGSSAASIRIVRYSDG
ncbi:hypothetical protein J2Z48_001672 [Croceifilum oryzae]|uniref:Uncharacterized protein n=1 Tax=Croceifilum oryzae TaxID=1553429 RepID=A0AAJ1TK27_9BACL|nr:hypothetical protein [Croceifilum oryzae]MDQ0417499.1 hypothetical protein [Croceifilum oryzae]